MTTAIAFYDALTAAETAVVSRVSVRDVHRAIDERILPEGLYCVADKRTLTIRACVLISFYFRTAGRLTAEERQRAIALAAAFPDESRGERIIQDGFLTVNFAPFWNDVELGLERLQAAREMAVSDPEILDGTPVIRGTRVPVYDVAASVSAGIPVERILAAYPSLRREQVELAHMYAEANPQRGRPRLRDSVPPAARVIAIRRKNRDAATA